MMFSFWWRCLCRRCKIRKLAGRYVLTDYAGCFHPPVKPPV